MEGKELDVAGAGLEEVWNTVVLSTAPLPGNESRTLVQNQADVCRMRDVVCMVYLRGHASVRP